MRIQLGYMSLGMVQLSLDVLQQGLVAVDEAQKGFGWLVWMGLVKAN